MATAMLTPKIVFLTCHGKDLAVRSTLLKSGFELEIYDTLNTDTLGTFTGETLRPRSQMETALKKATIFKKASRMISIYAITSTTLSKRTQQFG